MLKLYEYQGLLKSIPFPDRLVANREQQFNFINKNSFARLSEYKINNDLPILINFAEHVEMLEIFSRLAFKLFVDIHWIVIRFISSNIKLPKLLLEPRIIITVDSLLESQYLQQQGEPHIYINDSFLRHRNEQGSNQLQIGLYTAHESSHQFSVYVKTLECYGISKARMLND